MLKKGFPALFQLGSSRSEFAAASEHQQLSVVDVRASHPWLAFTRPVQMSFNGLVKRTTKPRLDGAFLHVSFYEVR